MFHIYHLKYYLRCLLYLFVILHFILKFLQAKSSATLQRSSYHLLPHFMARPYWKEILRRHLFQLISSQGLWGYGPKNLWAPTFIGVINHLPVGSDIEVTVSLEGFDAVVIIAYHLFFLTAMLIGFQVSFILFLFMFLIFALADGTGYSLSFVQGVRFFESEINSVISKD